MEFLCTIPVQPSPRTIPVLPSPRTIPVLPSPRTIPVLPPPRTLPVQPSPRTIPVLPSPRTIPSTGPTLSSYYTVNLKKDFRRIRLACPLTGIYMKLFRNAL